MSHPKWGNVFQIALGGGEPLEHPDFLSIIKITKDYGIIPNFTTNGVNISANIAQAIEGQVGAVAISTDNLNIMPAHAIKILKKFSIKTNLHFLLSKKTVKQAIQILKGKYNYLLQGINAIIFLTCKPAGRASSNNCLKWNSELKTFVQLIDQNQCSARIGFDACFVPILLHATSTATEFIDPCECGLFSVYIDENLNVKPCSFDNSESFTFNMKEHKFHRIWKEKFIRYRDLIENDCERICSKRLFCRGKCHFYNEINLCYSIGIKESFFHDTNFMAPTKAQWRI